MQNLYPNSRLVRLSGAVAAGVDGAVVNLPEVDMRGFSAIALIFVVGSIAANGVLTTFVKNSDTSNTYGAGTIDRVGSNLANNADTDDDKFHVHDIYRPLRRYVRPSYQRTGGNVAIDAVIAVLYNPDHAPVDNSNVEAAQVLNSPVPSAT